MIDVHEDGIIYYYVGKSIPSSKIGKSWRGWMGCGQTDGLQSPQIRPSNHGMLPLQYFIVSSGSILIPIVYYSIHVATQLPMSM